MNQASCISQGLWPARKSQIWRTVLLIVLPLLCAGLLLISCRSNRGSERAAAPSIASPAAGMGGGAALEAILDMPAGIDLSKQPGTKYQVTYAEDVIHLSAPTIKHYLVGVNRDHDIYVFTDAPELREKLRQFREDRDCTP